MAWLTDGILVETKYGLVRGETRFVPQGSGPITAVNRFLGIPYARPPVGALRFRDPLPPAAWKPSVYNATVFGKVCLQQRNNYFRNSIREVWPSFTWESDSSEDCLYLNVFAPANSTSDPYPVMIFIHGGSYFYGTSARPQTPGDILPLSGVVLVTIQYRLGPFGFLTTGDSAAPGNFGMRDQLMAMTWVRDNIGNFGGNPSKVTIFGVSAGGSSVGLQLLSPLSKGLFHQAIAESGVEFSSFAFLPLEKAVATTRNVAKQLDCDVTSGSATVDCLRSKKAEEIIALYKLGDTAPVIDGMFLTGTPTELRNSGEFHRVPFMAGFNSQDAAHNVLTKPDSFTSKDIFRQEINSFANEIAPLGDKVSLVPDALEFQYTPWPNGQSTTAEVLYNKVVDMQTDYHIAAPTVKSLAAHNKFTSATYMYEFSHKSIYSTKVGVRHGENTKYDFGVPLVNASSEPFSAQDQNVSRFLMTVYSNFAKCGRPTPQPVDGVMWGEFNATHQLYVRIQHPPVAELNFQPHRMAFWNSYYHQLEAFLESCHKNGPCAPTPTRSNAHSSQIRGQLIYCCTVFVLWLLLRGI